MVHTQAKGTVEHVLVWEPQDPWSAKVIMIDHVCQQRQCTHVSYGNPSRWIQL